MSLLKDLNDKFVGYLENTKKTMIYLLCNICKRIMSTNSLDLPLQNGYTQFDHNWLINAGIDVNLF